MGTVPNSPSLALIAVKGSFPREEGLAHHWTLSDVHRRIAGGPVHSPPRTLGKVRILVPVSPAVHASEDVADKAWRVDQSISTKEARHVGAGGAVSPGALRRRGGGGSGRIWSI